MSVYSQLVIAQSPVVYYRLNDGSGLPQDSSGNGLHISSLGSAPTYSNTGARSGNPTDWAMGFDGTDDTLDRTDHASLDLADTFTIMCQVKIRATPTFHPVLVDKGAGGYQFRLNPDMKMEINHENTAVVATGTTALTVGTWYHIACTKSGSTRKLYLNGVDDTAALPADSTMVNTIDALRIAGRNAGGSEYANALIQDVALWGSALTVGTILAIATAFVDSERVTTRRRRGLRRR